MDTIIFDLTLDLFSKIAMWGVAIVFAWLVKVINDRVKNDKIKFHLAEATDMVNRAVIMTNQMFVDELKEQGQFDLSKAKKAFRASFNDVKEHMSEETKKVVKDAYGDLDHFITTEIERQVALEKEHKDLIKAEYLQ